MVWKRTLKKGLGPSGEERLSQKTTIIKNQLRRRDAALHFANESFNCNSSMVTVLTEVKKC